MIKQVSRNGVDFRVAYDTENKNFWDIDGWERENYLLIKEKSKKHTTFINAGGWIGPFTLFSSKLFDSVYSLEPDIVAFNELKRNVEINNLTNVKIFNKAFSDNTENIKIGSDYSNLGGSGTSIFQGGNAITVSSVTLNAFFEAEKVGLGSFLMLDVEGSEFLLFDDYNFFSKFKPTILLSLHLTFLNDENYIRLIKSLTKLSEIYDFDLELIRKSRKTLTYKSKFKEINVLMEYKK